MKTCPVMGSIEGIDGMQAQIRTNPMHLINSSPMFL